MDKRLEKALEFANYSNTLLNQKKLARQRFLDSCVFYYEAGKFTASQQLITYSNSLVKDSIILDDNNVPIKIKSINKFQKDLLKKYTDAINEYYDEYQRLTSKKTVKDLLDE